MENNMLDELKEDLVGIDIRFDEPLKRYTYTKVGGPADYRGKQPQDARKLRHGQDEVRPASHHRFTRAPGSHSPRNPEHPWHLQDQHQV